MGEQKIKKGLPTEKGITLIALVITVAIMLIIIGVSVLTGTDSLDSTRLQGFYMQLQIVQKRADDIAITNEKYTFINNEGTEVEIDIKTQGGSSLKEEQRVWLQNVLNEESITTPANEFRYFTISDLQKQLDLSDVEYNVFIHFDSRTIVAKEGITIDGTTYYVLKDKDNMYYPTTNVNKNKGEITSLKYLSITKYGSNYYKIIVEPNNTVGDLNKTGTVKYKKHTSQYWETLNSLEILIDELGDYDILYEDINNNSFSETIKVYIEDGTLKITVYNYS